MISEAEQGKYITEAVDNALGNHPAASMVKLVSISGWMKGRELAKEEGIPEEDAWESFKLEVLNKIPNKKTK